MAYHFKFAIKPGGQPFSDQFIEKNYVVFKPHHFATKFPASPNLIIINEQDIGFAVFGVAEF